MAWGARQEEDSTWRLCERRGGTVLRLLPPEKLDVEIRFPGRAKAEQCAATLNEAFWPEYEQHRRKKTALSAETIWAMLEIIHAHQGITPEDMQRIREYGDRK